MGLASLSKPEIALHQDPFRPSPFPIFESLIETTRVLV